MAVFRVERNKGYTVMSNHHLRNKELSLKAKGLLSQAWQRRQGFYRYLNVAALPCSLIPTPPDDEQSPGIFHLQEDFE